MSDDEAAARARIERFYASLHKRNHFDLLGVDQEARPEQIRQQFMNLGKSWHIDAFAGIELSEEEKRKVDEIFQTLSQAHETLKDPAARAEYLVLLERKQQGLATDVHAVLRAEGLVDDALQAMAQRRWPDAISKLDEARDLNPDDPLYEVYRAWCTYQSQRSSHAAQSQAIEQLKKALKKQENMPLAHQYLGQIHFDREEYDQAIKRWRICLQQDPKNIEATRGLRLAKGRKEKAKGGLGGLIGKLFGK